MIFYLNLLLNNLNIIFLAQQGRAYVFNCPFSTLCRQVVTDPQGRVAHFDFKSDSGEVHIKVSEKFHTNFIPSKF